MTPSCSPCRGRGSRHPFAQSAPIAAALLTIGLLLGAPPPAAADPDGGTPLLVPMRPSGPDLRVFAGVWGRIDDARAEAERLANIDSAIADLSWILRKMASGVLRDGTVPPPEVRFRWTGDELVQQVSVEGRATERRVELRADVSETDGGADASERSESAWRWRDDGRLEVLWRHAQARGSTRFRHDPADDELHVEYEIQVTALDGIAPIRYGSRFARRAAPEIAATAAIGTAPEIAAAAEPGRPDPVALR